MKKKIVGGLMTIFFILIMVGLAHANTIDPPVADADGPYEVMWGGDYS